MTEAKPDVVTSAEAIEMLQVSHGTLFNLIKRGRLTPLPSSPALERPKRLLFRREDVERILEEGRRKREG